MSKGERTETSLDEVMRQIQEVGQSLDPKANGLDSAATTVSETPNGGGAAAPTDPGLKQSLADIERSLNEQAARRNDMLARLRQGGNRAKTTGAPVTTPPKGPSNGTRFDDIDTAREPAAPPPAQAREAAPAPAPAPKPPPNAAKPAPAPKAAAPARPATPLNDSVREALARTEARRERLRNQQAAPAQPAAAKPQPKPAPAPAPVEPPPPPMDRDPTEFAAKAPVAPPQPTPQASKPAPKAATPKSVEAPPAPEATPAPAPTQEVQPQAKAAPKPAAPVISSGTGERRTPAPQVTVPGAPTSKAVQPDAAPQASAFPNPFASTGAPSPTPASVAAGAPKAAPKLKIAPAPAPEALPKIMTPKTGNGLAVVPHKDAPRASAQPTPEPLQTAFNAPTPPPLSVQKVNETPPPFKPSGPSSTPAGVVADFAELGMDTPAVKKGGHPPELGTGYVTQSYTFKPEDFATPDSSGAVLGEHAKRGGIWVTLRRTAYAITALVTIFAAQYFLLTKNNSAQQDAFAEQVGATLAGFDLTPSDDVAEVETVANNATVYEASTAAAIEPINNVTREEPVISASPSPSTPPPPTEDLSRERVLQVQSLLKVMGYDVPEADGVMNDATWAAVQTFRGQRQIKGDDIGPRFMVELRLAAAEGHRAP